MYLQIYVEQFYHHPITHHFQKKEAPYWCKSGGSILVQKWRLYFLRKTELYDHEFFINASARQVVLIKHIQYSDRYIYGHAPY